MDNMTRSCRAETHARETDGVSIGNAAGGDRSDVDRVVERVNQTLDLVTEATAGLSPNRCQEDRSRSDAIELSIIVPVFNEVDTLPRVLDRIDSVMPPATEVIVVDDGSTDGTSTWLRSQTHPAHRRIFCRRRNHGKGSAVRLAIRHSRGRAVAIQDADLEYDPGDLLGVVAPILAGAADVVYGSRYLGPSRDPSWLHRAGNWLLTRLSNQLTGLQLTDMETCHKAFRGDLIREIPLRECRFGFEPEITAKIAHRGVAIEEVATGYDSRGYDEGKKIGWRDAVAALVCMWKYRHG